MISISISKGRTGHSRSRLTAPMPAARTLTTRLERTTRGGARRMVFQSRHIRSRAFCLPTGRTSLQVLRTARANDVRSGHQASHRARQTTPRHPPTMPVRAKRPPQLRPRILPAPTSPLRKCPAGLLLWKLLILYWYQNMHRMRESHAGRVRARTGSRLSSELLQMPGESFLPPSSVSLPLTYR